ncbi:MAG: argininosuccinate lyase [Pseudomonadota bacterium]
MIRLALIPLLFCIAACGVDGPPIPPSQVEEREPEEARTGLTITGSAEFGITG